VLVQEKSGAEPQAVAKQAGKERPLSLQVQEVAGAGGLQNEQRQLQAPSKSKRQLPAQRGSR
jgi:hypothetical protein